MGHPVGSAFARLCVDRLEVWETKLTDKLLLEIEVAVSIELTLDRTDVCNVEWKDAAEVRPVVLSNVGGATMGKDSRSVTVEPFLSESRAGVGCVAIEKESTLVKIGEGVGYTVT